MSNYLTSTLCTGLRSGIDVWIAEELAQKDDIDGLAQSHTFGTFGGPAIHTHA
jgi:hypothetical protein